MLYGPMYLFNCYRFDCKKMISKYLVFKQFQQNSITCSNHYQDRVPVNIWTKKKWLAHKRTHTYPRTSHTHTYSHAHIASYIFIKHELDKPRKRLKWNEMEKKEIKGKVYLHFIGLSDFSFVVFISLCLCMWVWLCAYISLSSPQLFAMTVKHPLKFSSVYSQHCFLIVKSAFIVKNFYSMFLFYVFFFFSPFSLDAFRNWKKKYSHKDGKIQMERKRDHFKLKELNLIATHSFPLTHSMWWICLC